MANFRSVVFTLFALACLRPGFAHAEVQLVEKTDSELQIGQKQGEPWQEGEEMCVVRGDNTLACGPIVESTATGARIAVGDAALEVKPGDHVQTYREIQERGGNIILTMGMAAGPGYYFPNLTVQYRMFSQWYLGLSGSLSQSTEDNFLVKSKGLMLSANHYAIRDPFKNFWFRAAMGIYAFDVSSAATSESAVAPYLLTTVGWRGVFAKYLTVGLAGGFQYVPSQIKSTQIRLRELEPVVTVDIGVRF